MMSMAWFVVAAVFFASGGLAMKWSEGLTRLLPSLGVFGCFAAGAACQAVGMRTVEMGSAYVLVLGLEAVVAAALATLVLGEPLTAGKVGAIVLILVGITWLERS
jgi:quaternary ammonium compound-resistance protein SugE